MFNIGPAQPTDLPALLDLLHRCGLKDDGFAEHLPALSVLRTHHAIIACAGLEVYGDTAILRSVAVDPAYRGQGLGKQIVQAVLRTARLRTVATVYLLTQTAEPFFARLDFVRVERACVPPPLLASVQFTSMCPATTPVMRLSLHNGEAAPPWITIEQAHSLYAGAEAAHDIDHVLRVLALAERLARAEGADRGIIYAAALLHDIARSSGEDHAIAGARQARRILEERGAPLAFVDAVAAAIRDHRFRTGAPPQTLEGRILYDADKLDAIGAIGVARAYAVGSRLGQRLWSAVDAGDSLDQAQPTHIPEEHTPVREFVVKLSKLKKTLFTAEARRIARGRHRFMVSFFKRLNEEVAGDL